MSKYWQERIQDTNDKLYSKSLEEIEKKLTKVYRKAFISIEKEMVSIFNEIKAEALDGEIKPNDIYKFNRFFTLIGFLLF